MKPLLLLKTLVDLFLVFSIFGAIAVLLTAPIMLINPDLEIPVSMQGTGIVGDSPATVVLIALTGLGAFFFVYAIFILRKIIVLFIANEVFTNRVVTHFRLVGKCIITSTLLTIVPLFLYEMIENNNLEIQFGSNGFDSGLLSISLGLLFIVIGEMFQKAKDLKEESDLTV